LQADGVNIDWELPVAQPRFLPHVLENIVERRLIGEIHWHGSLERVEDALVSECIEKRNLRLEIVCAIASAAPFRGKL
jgi:hypothetical protein